MNEVIFNENDMQTFETRLGAVVETAASEFALGLADLGNAIELIARATDQHRNPDVVGALRRAREHVLDGINQLCEKLPARS